MTGMEEVYALKDEINKAKTEISLAERTRNGLLYMDAKIRLENALEKLSEYTV